MNPRVYLSGAIEFATDLDWFNNMATELSKLGFTVIDPTEFGKEIKIPKTDIERYSQEMKALAILEFSFCSKADFILARITKETLKGCGTYCECAIGFANDIEIILWLDGVTIEDCPGFLFGLSDRILYSKEEVLSYFSKQINEYRSY